MSTRKQRIALAVEHLDAMLINGHGYAYYDRGTCSWWISKASDMAELGVMLHRAAMFWGTNTDIYSLWCKDHLAREMPHGYGWINRRLNSK